MTAITNRDGCDFSFTLAACATRTTIVITSAWIVMFTMLTAPPTKNCRNISSSRHLRRQHVESDGKDRVDEYQQNANEPGRTPAACDERRNTCGNKDHHYRAGPELQIHRRRSDDVTQQHEHGADEYRNLRSTPQRNTHAQVKPVLTRCRKRHCHFGSSAYECYDDKTDERLAHPECLCGLLYRLDENLAY